MTWKTPKIVEVPVGMEINMYACAARKKLRSVLPGSSSQLLRVAADAASFLLPCELRDSHP